MIPCFNRDGMINMIGWYLAETIVGNFDKGMAEFEARKAVDPNYKPDPFADKPKASKTPFSLAEYCARIREGGGSRDGMREG